METNAKTRPDPQAVAVVLLADLAQIMADSRTHSDMNARERIAKAVERISSIAEGKMTPSVRAKVSKAIELLSSASTSTNQEELQPVVWQFGDMEIHAVAQPDGARKFAIRRNGEELGRDGEWEIPSSPSNRPADHLAAHRWDTLADAVRAAQESRK